MWHRAAAPHPARRCSPIHPADERRHPQAERRLPGLCPSRRSPRRGPFGFSPTGLFVPELSSRGRLRQGKKMQRTDTPEWWAGSRCAWCTSLPDAGHSRWYEWCGSLYRPSGFRATFQCLAARPAWVGSSCAVAVQVRHSQRAAPQEYGLTAGYIQRYKIAASPCSCACLLT